MIERIARFPIFAALPDELLGDLAAGASERRASAGRVLVERDHPASGMFVLEEGRAVVELGDRTVELGPGDVFGEVALVGLSAARTARVRALTDTRCISFPRADVDRVLEREPAFASRLRSLAEARLAAQTG